MKRPHTFHILIAFFSMAIYLTFLMGTSRAIAAPQPIPTPPISATLELTLAADQSPTLDLTPEPSATPSEELISADTTGIIALAIALIVIVVFGVLWGGRSTPRAAKRKE